jgi:hypothetical protein
VTLHSLAETYRIAATGMQVGFIGRNDVPIDVTTVDGFYGFCYKDFNEQSSGGVITETVFYCEMSNPRG